MPSVPVRHVTRRTTPTTGNTPHTRHFLSPKHLFSHRLESLYMWACGVHVSVSSVSKVQCRAQVRLRFPPAAAAIRK